MNANENLMTKCRQICVYGFGKFILGHNKNTVKEIFIELKEQIKKVELFGYVRLGYLCHTKIHPNHNKI